MTANTDAMMREALRAMKAGNNEEAQALLMKITEYEETDNRAWLLLFDIMESREDKQICLENALYIDPDNTEALAGEIRNILEDSALQESMREQGYKHAMQFTEDIIAENIMQVYKKALK